ncbi:MAG: AraC family transcriptional regulator [Atopobiaceae bacterium]|nr:AraC family transcriptional regulator [Atopobiaceae bacterium]
MATPRRTSRSSCANVAEVGYTSYSHFNRIFKQVYRITPAAYRSFAVRELAL